MYPDNFEPLPDENPPRSRFKSCLIGLLTAVVIIALLGTSVVGVLWFLRSRDDARVVTETLNPIIPTVAANPRPIATATPLLPATIVAETTSESAQPATLLADAINRIVYVTADNRVATVNPDGSDGRLLTDTRRNYLFPAWSPAGNEIAVIANSQAGAAVVHLQDEIEGEENNLYFSNEDPVIYLYWSPDGRYLSFISNNADGGLGLQIADPRQTEESRLLTLGQPFYWQWTADAQRLFIHTGVTGGDARLALIDAAGDGEGENISAPGLFQAPGISADGRYWAYAEAVSADSSWLVVAEAASGELQRQEHAGQVAMGWSPTANQLAYISGLEGDGRFYGPLRLLDAESGEMRVLISDLVLAFFWSPDGRYIAYFTPNILNDNDVQAVARRGLAKPTQQQAIKFNLFVVEVATGEGLQLASFTPTFIFFSQFLPFFDQYALSHRLWAPDSSALVLPMRQEDESRIFVVPIGGGQPHEVGLGDMAFWSHK